MKYFSTLSILLLLVITACTKQSGTKVVTNVNGYTIAGDSVLEFSAIAFQNGKIVGVGGDEIQQKFAGATIIDGESKTMLPGLTDAHGHVMGLGFQELQVNVAGIKSLDETLEKIKEYAEDNPDLEWIQGRGWNQTLWEETEFPTGADLDDIISDRPVWLSRVNGHAGWAIL